MTPGEFAEATGLTEEEAGLILERRRIRSVDQASGGKLQRAFSALVAAQKRTGVHPVVVTGGGVEKTHDPDADVGVQEFYKKTPPADLVGVKLYPVTNEEDVSQDPKDW